MKRGPHCWVDSGEDMDGRDACTDQSGEQRRRACHLVITTHDGQWGKTMPTREMAFCFALSGLAATAAAQTAPTPEQWTPFSAMAQKITGRVTFSMSEITFQNGQSLSLARGGQMLFKPEAKTKKVMADLYRVTLPADPVLENGNKLCKGKSVAYLIVWKSEKVGNQVDPRTLAPFSGQRFSAGSPDDCGRYIYDAGRP
jgi:hypothetical protein